jgi:hypothetical protein
MNLQSYRKEVWLLLHKKDTAEMETAAVRLYMDESGGTDPNTPHAVVGAFLIQRSRFLTFEGRWERMLARHGINPPLHMKEFGRPHGRFASMPDECRNELMIDAVSLIETYKVGSLSVSLSNQDFERLVTEEVRNLFGVYAMCFMWAALLTHVLAKRAKFMHRIPYILDSGNPHASHVRAAHASMMYMQKLGTFLNVGGLLFEDDELFGSLQAADVIAWGARKRAGGISIPYPFDPINQIFDDRVRHAEAKWFEEWLSELGEGLSRSIAEMKEEQARTGEFERFDETMQRLVKVPHSAIKAKLDAEKAAKKRKPKRTSASDRASGKD